MKEEKDLCYGFEKVDDPEEIYSCSLCLVKELGDKVLAFFSLKSGFVNFQLLNKEDYMRRKPVNKYFWFYVLSKIGLYEILTIIKGYPILKDYQKELNFEEE